MDTPICDFIKAYAESDALRLHMPGHKGICYTGAESADITEIDGADNLFAARGIIRKSEENAGKLFGAHTFYSAEGSSLCIRAMLYLTMLFAHSQGRRPVIAAARNVHKTFISTAALLDLDVVWLPAAKGSYMSGNADADVIDGVLADSGGSVTAVYLTSPDYLGRIADISAVSGVCRKHGALLITDNAHGAYLKFLENSCHPIDLGADMCCDSAHKTLPALTGGAYLHISRNAPDIFAEQARSALSLFASTSPSYLILQSLDALNKYIDNGYRKKLSAFLEEVCSAREQLTEQGFELYGNEPLKITVAPRSYGYTGEGLARIMKQSNAFCEFADPDYTVLMLTPELGQEGIKRLLEIMSAIPRREPVQGSAPPLPVPERVMSMRDAAFAQKEEIPAKTSTGRVFADINIACPPAVPLVICGERIQKEMYPCFDYYGIEKCIVVR